MRATSVYYQPLIHIRAIGRTSHPKHRGLNRQALCNNGNGWILHLPVHVLAVCQIYFPPQGNLFK